MNRLGLPELIQENLAFMRLAITLLALSIVTGAGLYLGGAAFLKYAEGQSLTAKRRAMAAQQQLSRAGTEKEEIRLYLPAYQSLAMEGKTGEERRLEWIDALTRIREQNKLFPIDYDIASRRPYTLPAGPPANALNVSASRMDLRFGMLHEGDLLTLLNGLQAEGKGFYVLDRCTVNRNVTGSSPQYGQNLQGNCTLDWLSFQPSGNESPKPGGSMP